MDWPLKGKGFLNIVQAILTALAGLLIRCAKAHKRAGVKGSRKLVCNRARQESGLVVASFAQAPRVKGHGKHGIGAKPGLPGRSP